jgi:hypothetical protein
MAPQQAPEVDQYPIYQSILKSIEPPRLWLKLARSLSKEHKYVWVKLGSGGQGTAYLVKLPLSLEIEFGTALRELFPLVRGPAVSKAWNHFGSLVYKYYSSKASHMPDGTSVADHLARLAHHQDQQHKLGRLCKWRAPLLPPTHHATKHDPVSDGSSMQHW